MKTQTKNEIKLERWERADNYVGEDWSDYYIGPAYTRDSDILDQSNFHVALDLLGGESDTVIVERCSHWACGWFERILVNRSDADAVSVLTEITERIERYPVLDESDYYDRERDASDADFECYKNKFRSNVEKAFGKEIFKGFSDKSVEEYLYALFLEYVSSDGQRDAFINDDQLVIRLRTENIFNHSSRTARARICKRILTA
jgi:hypothetical protein